MFMPRGWMTMLAAQSNYIMTPGVSDSEAYITAPCFIINSLTTVGFINVAANTKYENIFAVIIMMIGALMHATILHEFTELHNMPKQLKQRMQDYFSLSSQSITKLITLRSSLTTLSSEVIFA